MPSVAEPRKLTSPFLFSRLTTSSSRRKSWIVRLREFRCKVPLPSILLFLQHLVFTLRRSLSELQRLQLLRLTGTTAHRPRSTLAIHAHRHEDFRYLHLTATRSSPPQPCIAKRPVKPTTNK